MQKNKNQILINKNQELVNNFLNIFILDEFFGYAVNCLNWKKTV